MYENLKIIYYPDPRLKKISKAVETFDENLRALSVRMLELMREAKGVGLAAPQVGLNIRLFVMNPSGKLEDDRVIVNPVLSNGEGSESSEEGCLSLPKINIEVMRDVTLHLSACDLDGKPVEETATGYIARIWQHETDHLNGVLLTDRMGPVAKLTNRKILRDLEEQYAEAHPVKRKAR